MRILYVSGGSAGHLAPLVAVERAVKQMDASAESLFLCSDRPDDATYLKKEGVTFQVLPRVRRSLSFPATFIKNFLMSANVIDTFKPDAVFSKGGAVSIPACIAAHRRGIPVVLHESDAVMGRANGFAARWADVVCEGFPSGQRLEAGGSFSFEPPATGHRKIFTGNPIRPGVTQGSRAEGLKLTGLTGTKPVLLVLGGSQGAEALNLAVRTHIDSLLKIVDIVHLTGKGKSGAGKRDGYWSTEFAHEVLPHLYAIASLALSRAGAGSIGELAANGIPTMLVPIRGLANDHQVRNAEIAVAHGGCMLLEQSDLNAQLERIVVELTTNERTLTEMSTKIRTFQQPDASRRIAEILAQCIAHRRDAL